VRSASTSTASQSQRTSAQSRTSTLGRLSDPPPPRQFTVEVAGDILFDKIGDEVHLGSDDLGENGGGSELLHLGALDLLPDPHRHVDDVDHQIPEKNIIIVMKIHLP